MMTKKSLPASSVVLRCWISALISVWNWSGRAQEPTDSTSPQINSPTKASPNDPLPAPESDQVRDGEKRDAPTFSRHNPSFYAYGNPTAKLQFSFKFRLIRRLSFYGAYTQTMFWELQKESVPFSDVNFNPEFFYTYDTRHEALETVDFIPMWHKSNGTDGEKSRSTEGFGLRFNGKRELKTSVFRYSISLLRYYDFDPGNQNLREYWGPWQSSVSYLQFYKSFIDRTEITFKFWGGGRFGQNLGKGGRELSIAFRVFGFDVTPSFYLALFDGYGESFLQFNQRQTRFRAGLMF